MSRLAESGTDVDHYRNIYYRGDRSSERRYIFHCEIRFHHAGGITQHAAGQVEGPGIRSLQQFGL
jgi:hypothetical protein